MPLRFCERQVFRVHLACIGVLVGAHVLLRVLHRFAPGPEVQGLRWMFGLNAEHNVPSMFSALAILAAGLMLFATASAVRARGRPHVASWCLLGAVFVFLAVDEWFSLHEMLNRPVRDALQVGGPLYFAWVVPYAALTGLLALVLWRFVVALDPTTRRAFLVAGVVYVTGALLLEMIGGMLWLSAGMQSRLYFLETTAEETLEMLGIALFIRALLGHYRREFGEKGSVPSPKGTLPFAVKG
jgi:hypothetical protein